MINKKNKILLYFLGMGLCLIFVGLGYMYTCNIVTSMIKPTGYYYGKELSLDSYYATQTNHQDVALFIIGSVLGITLIPGAIIGWFWFKIDEKKI